MKKKKNDPARKATIREFAESIGRELSPTMLDLQVQIAVELLRENHGIKSNPKELLAEIAD